MNANKFPYSDPKLYLLPLKSEVLLGHLGLEPRTIRLKAEYSTIELVTLESMR